MGLMAINPDLFKTHLWGCGRIDKKIPLDKQVQITIGDTYITFCEWECFIERIGRLIRGGYNS